MSQHIILLIQPTDSSESRTYLDFSSPAQAWDAVVRLFEERLRAMTPGVGKLTYDVQQLFLYLDNLADLSCMIRDSNAAKGKVSYNAHPKDYIKQSVLAHLQRQAGGGGGGGGGSGGGRRH